MFLKNFARTDARYSQMRRRNHYETSNNTMGFHSDDPSALQPGTGVAIVSLGNSRNITYRNQKNPSLQHILTLSSGSVLYMKSTVQDEWLDAINRHVGASNVLALHGVPFAPTNLIKLNLKSLPYKVKNIK